MSIQPIGNAVAQSAQLASQPISQSGTKSVPEAGVAPAESQAAQQPSEERLAQVVADINAVMQKLSPGLEFTIDQESNRTIVKVIDQQTKELIRQMPSADTLEIAKALDKVQGLLIRARA